MEMRYITTDNTVWLQVKLEPSTRIVALLQFLKINFDRRNNSRDYFTIEEGVYKGSSASVSQKTANTSWLGSPLPVYQSAVTLTFKKASGELITPIDILKAKTDSSNPIANGQHPIPLPDFPHSSWPRVCLSSL